MERKMDGGAIKHLYQSARELRNEPTHAEPILWCYLKTEPLGFKFSRQHPYSIYILDFYCHSLQLVLEVDGSIHIINELKENDKLRQDLLEKDGLTITRFDNKQVENNLAVVRKYIEDFLRKHKDE